MEERYEVFIVLTLHRRVLQWGELDQAEFAAIIDQIREFGVLALLGNERMCAIETMLFDADDVIERIDFWLKVRGDWLFLSLEVRSEHTYILHDVKPGSGP